MFLCVAALAAVPAHAADDGADTYKTKCLMCHAADGSGNTPAGKIFKAASLKDPMVMTKSNDELTVVIKNGKNKMPAWKDKLTDAQIEAVIGYIRKMPD